MIFKDKSKSHPITKEQVWEAFKLVKANGGSAGVDGMTIQTIAKNPEKHLYPVWNRLASGSYFPPAVKRESIPKGDGKERHLGIPTVKDRVAQMVITKELEEVLLLWLSSEEKCAPSHRTSTDKLLALCMGHRYGYQRLL